MCMLFADVMTADEVLGVIRRSAGAREAAE
jgi:hypothetical protein